jgi:outer membrane protein assembly factor BamB
MNQAPARSGRVSTWLIAVLVLAFAGLAGYQSWHRGRAQADPELLHALEHEALNTADVPLGQPGDWPQWRGPRRDGIASETKLLTQWPENGPRMLWKAESGSGFSSMAVADGRLFTLVRRGETEIVLCLDAETGSEKLRHTYPCKFNNQYGAGGPRSTPTVDGDRVYTVGAAGILHCLSVETGSVLWAHDLLNEFKASNLQWGVSFSPLVEGNLVFTMPGGPEGNSLAAFDKRDGRLVWQSLDDPAGYASPVGMTVAGTRHIVFFTGKNLVGVAPQDGKQLWSYPWATDHCCNIATPIVRGEYVFIASGYGKGCALLKVVQEGGRFEAKCVYAHKKLRSQLSSSVLVGEHIFGFDEQAFSCLDFRTGKVVWTERRAFGRGMVLAVGDKLVVLGESGELAVLEAAASGFHRLSAFRFSTQAQCWAAPALARNRLYVRDDDKIVCYDVAVP